MYVSTNNDVSALRRKGSPVDIQNSCTEEEAIPDIDKRGPRRDQSTEPNRTRTDHKVPEPEHSVVHPRYIYVQGLLGSRYRTTSADTSMITFLI